MSEETREALIATASDHIKDIIYTVAFDVCNEIIEAGGNQEATLECANRVVARYVGEGIKVRKKPAPRAKAPQKDKQVDAVTAASRKLNKKSFTWIHHPETEDYSYTTDVMLKNGHPLRNNHTSKIEKVINEEGALALTVTDAKIALSYGLDVDFEAVEK